MFISYVKLFYKCFFAVLLAVIIGNLTMVLLTPGLAGHSIVNLILFNVLQSYWLILLFSILAVLLVPHTRYACLILGILSFLSLVVLGSGSPYLVILLPIYLGLAVLLSLFVFLFTKNDALRRF